MQYQPKGLLIALIFIILSYKLTALSRKIPYVTESKTSGEKVAHLFKSLKANNKTFDDVNPHVKELILLYQKWDDEDHRKEKLDNLFKKFQATKNLLYSSSTEMQYRRQVFEDNVHKACLHNLNYVRGSQGYHLGITKFADLTDDEFLNRYTVKMNASQFNSNKESTKSLFDSLPNTKALFSPSYSSPSTSPDSTSPSSRKKLAATYPNSIDFRTQNVIGPIEDQGNCGSCYSFSSVAAVEAAYTMKYGDGSFKQLSKQEMVDCGRSSGLALNGCRGGVLMSAYTYLANLGISKAKDYPYTHMVGKCYAYKAPRFVTIAGYTMLENVSKDGLLTMLSRRPSSIAVQMMPYLKLYKGGLVDVKGPCGYMYNHGILAVGYSLGQKAGEPSYLIMKNTYGSNWGIDGYMNYSIGVGAYGMCAFINSNDSQPII